MYIPNAGQLKKELIKCLDRFFVEVVEDTECLS